MTDTRQALAARYIALLGELAGNWEVMAEMESGSQAGRRETLRECADGLRMLADIISRAALSAQPVAGAAPAPEPSAQAVITELEQRLIEIAKTLPPMTTLGWNDGGMCEPDEAIKGYTKKQVLEILAQHLSASPQPEPSAQGEPVAFDRMEVRAIVQQAYLALEELQGPGFLIGGVMHYRIGMILPKLNEAINALASAPSTPPPAVEAVPLCQCNDRLKSECPGEWEPGCDLGANEKFAVVGVSDLSKAMQPVGLTDEQIDRIAENCAKSMPDGIQGFCKTWGWRQFARELLDICAGHYRAHGIAPKAAQEKP